jgi:hypothetical protein
MPNSWGTAASLRNQAIPCVLSGNQPNFAAEDRMAGVANPGERGLDVFATPCKLTVRSHKRSISGNLELRGHKI